MQFLLSAALSVGIAVATPAQANAPKRTILDMTAKEYALFQVKTYYGADYARQFACLTQLIQKESGWRVLAHNKSSGAFGLFQFLPSTWENYKYPTKPKDHITQINAGLRYIYKRYNTPCKAWEHWQKTAGDDLIGGWY